MARILYPDPNTLPTADRELLADLPPLNAFRLIAGSSSLFQPLIKFFSAYLSEGVLDVETREILILRVGHLCGSAYEVTQHERAAATFGMSDARIHATALGGDSSVFTEKERALIAFTDEVVKHVRPSDAMFRRVAAYFDHAELLEITTLIGIYIMWCQLFETFHIEIESDPLAANSIDDVRESVSKLD